MCEVFREREFTVSQEVNPGFAQLRPRAKTTKTRAKTMESMDEPPPPAAGGALAPPAQRQAAVLAQRRAGVLAASDAHVCCVSGGTLRLLSTAPPHAEECALEPALLTCASFNAAGTRLLAAGGEKQVALWRLDAFSPSSALAAPLAPALRWTASKKVGCVAFSPDGAMALWADMFGEVHGVVLGDCENDTAPALILGHLSPVSHIAFSANGGAILTSDREGHVRSSHWPHAFVIECYYLSHMTPLQLLLPLRHAPLLLTVASDGAEVCYWRAHSGVLLGTMSAARLLGNVEVEAGMTSGGGGGCSSEGVDGTALGTSGGTCIMSGCEVVGSGLIALAFAGRWAVHLCAIECDCDAAHAKLVPRPELTVALAAQPIILAHSRGSGLLCALLAWGAVVLMPAAADGTVGFDAARTRTIALLAGGAADEPGFGAEPEDQDDDD